VKATTDGVVLIPSELAMMVVWSPSCTAMQLFVVPRSIPTTFAIFISPCMRNFQLLKSIFPLFFVRKRPPALCPEGAES